MSKRGSRNSQQLERSAALLNEAERLAKVGSWEQDLRTDQGRRSANLCSLLGVDESETQFQDRAFWELVHPEDRERVTAIIDKAMETGQPYEYEARFVLKDGSEHVFLTRGKPVVDSKHRIIKRIGVTQDITDRIWARQALQESEDRYRDLVENSRDLVFLHDFEGRLLWVNELPARMLGYTREELTGRFIPELLDADARPEFQEYLYKVSRDNHAEGLLRVIARTGERRTWQFHTTVRPHGPNGRIVRGMAHDITDLKRMEKDLRQQTRTVQGLFQTAQTLTQTLNVESIFDALKSQAMALFRADIACAGMRTISGFSCSRSLRDNESKIAFTRPFTGGIVGWVAANRRIYVNNNAEDSLFSAELRKIVKPRNVLCAPIFDIPKKEIAAFIAVLNKPTPFTHEDIATAKAITELASVAIQNALSFRKLQYGEVQLRRLSAELISARDRERRHIARVLHEETAQELAVLNHRLAAFVEPPSLAKQSQRLIQRALMSIRNLSYGLHPQELDVGGLWLAIHAYVRHFAKDTGIPVDLRIAQNLPRLDQLSEISIFRILQESLTHAHLHSTCQRVGVGAKLHAKQLILEVSGAEKGFDLDNTSEPAFDSGILEIKERAREIGATLKIRPRKGISVRLSLALSTVGGEHSRFVSDSALVKANRRLISVMTKSPDHPNEKVASIAGLTTGANRSIDAVADKNELCGTAADSDAVPRKILSTESQAYPANIGERRPKC